MQRHAIQNIREVKDIDQHRRVPGKGTRHWQAHQTEHDDGHKALMLDDDEDEYGDELDLEQEGDE